MSLSFAALVLFFPAHLFQLAELNVAFRLSSGPSEFRLVELSVVFRLSSGPFDSVRISARGVERCFPALGVLRIPATVLALAAALIRPSCTFVRLATIRPSTTSTPLGSSNAQSLRTVRSSGHFLVLLPCGPLRPVVWLRDSLLAAASRYVFRLDSWNGSVAGDPNLRPFVEPRDSLSLVVSQLVFRLVLRLVFRLHSGTAPFQAISISGSGRRCSRSGHRCLLFALRRLPSGVLPACPHLRLFEWHPGRPFIGFGRPPARLHPLLLHRVKLMRASCCPLQPVVLRGLHTR